MAEAINRHINIEWNASYNFLDISAWFETTPFKGFAKLMLERSEREERHALQFYEYLINRLGTAELMPVNKTAGSSFASPLEAFEKALAIKWDVTRASHELYALALKEGDFETQEFLHAFLQEQIQEEKHMQDNVDKLNLAGDNPDALIHLDYKEEVQYAIHAKS